MGIIRDLKLKIEELKNKYKILEGKLNKLKINVDLVNTKSKEFPDALTYKPQQPYILGTGIKLKLIKENTVYLSGYRDYWDYINMTNKRKVYFMVSEYKRLQFATEHEPERILESYRVTFENTTWDSWSPGVHPRNAHYFFIGDSRSEYDSWVHYKIYELVYDFGDLQIINQ